MTKMEAKAKAREMIMHGARTAYRSLRDEMYYDMTYSDFESVEDAIEVELKRVEKFLGMAPVEQVEPDYPGIHEFEKATEWNFEEVDPYTDQEA